MKIDTVETKARPAQILLVEDNYGDVVLTQKAFAAARITNVITVAKNANEALAILNKEGSHHSVPTPDLILLDLNLPGKSGEELLADIKQNDKLKRLPVVILTSSRAEADIVKSYGLHANSYIIKPINLEKFHGVVKSIENFWFTVVVLAHD